MTEAGSNSVRELRRDAPSDDVTAGTPLCPHPRPDQHASVGTELGHSHHPPQLPHDHPPQLPHDHPPQLPHDQHAPARQETIKAFASESGTLAEENRAFAYESGTLGEENRAFAYESGTLREENNAFDPESGTLGEENKAFDPESGTLESAPSVAETAESPTATVSENLGGAVDKEATARTENTDPPVPVGKGRPPSKEARARAENTDLPNGRSSIEGDADTADTKLANGRTNHRADASSARTNSVDHRATEGDWNSKTAAMGPPTTSVPSQGKGEEAGAEDIAVYKRRWYILAVFCVYSFSQACVWNTFGPISSTSEEAFGWTDADIALLSNWGPIAYIITAVFFSWMLDVKGTSFVFCLFKLSVFLFCIVFLCVLVDFLVKWSQSETE